MDHKAPRSIGIAPSDDITTYCYPEMNDTEAGTASNCNCFSYVMLDDAYNGMIPLTLLNLVTCQAYIYYIGLRSSVLLNRIRM
jgi:hypothetical protein